MRRAILITLLAFPALAQQPAPMAGFDDFAANAAKAWDVPGASIAVVAGGKVLYTKGVGLRDVKNNLPVTAETLFPIGSCTKAFTTFVMGQLVDEGKLDWDKPVNRYIPGFRLSDAVASQEITPRDLVTHRSGLPRHDLLWYNNQTLTRQQLVERLQYLPLSAELRERYQYNNLMFLTAGYLIEQITGKTWEAAVRERIFGPLGMTRSTFSDAEAQKSSDFAKPYREDHDKLLEIPFREVGNMGPAGSISSSANEMALWLLTQLGDAHKDLIAATTLRDLHTPQMVASPPPPETEFGPSMYAMGWSVDTYRGHVRLTHAGAIDGFSAAVALFPNDDAAIAVLTNADGTRYPQVMTLHAADRLLKLPPIDWNGRRLARRAAEKKMSNEAQAKLPMLRKSGTKPSHPLADYAGDYENPGYGVIHIQRRGDALAMSYNGIAAPLEHWHYDVFNALKTADTTFDDMKLQFEGDVNGNIVALRAPFEPAVPPMRFTKKADAKLSDPAYLKQFAGKYSIGPAPVSVDLQGDHLVATVPGARRRELVPAVDGWFDVKGVTGYRVRFDGDTMSISEPDGVYEGKRIR